jgi:uncharacterized membrane protein
VEFFFLIALLILGIPLVLPIAAWVSARRTRVRLEQLEEVIRRQRGELDDLMSRLAEIRREVAPAPAADRPPQAADVRTAGPPVEKAPEPPRAERPWAPTPVEPPPVPASKPPAPATAAPPPIVVPPKSPVPVVPRVTPTPVTPPSAAPIHSVLPPRPPRPPAPPEPPPPPAPAFDWEGLVGVKVFSAIAGIALVFAAVLFLNYSIESGWLQPPVRVAIGVVVAVALLVVCELKAARRYPITANAMDAAAIAILFSTFFAAHALWDLIPTIPTFALLTIVTVLAVLLSIRRESLFIAVLGLLGGFATPALLSTGENRPIPLFTYLLLLNVGLAWVAYARGWPILTWLTLILTVVYQWGWVFKFLDASSLPLAMGIFIIFPLASFAGYILRSRSSEEPGPDRSQFEQTAIVSSALPLAFAVYLAAIPAYGRHSGLLLGFLLVIDAGLLAISIVRRQPLLHALGAVTTAVVMAIWLAVSYVDTGATTVALGFTSAFVLLYLFAPTIARIFDRPLEGPAERAQFAAAAVLFVFPVLSGIEPAFVVPWPLVGTLIALLLIIAWREAASGAGHLYHLAGFFAVATQAVWSATHLTLDRLDTAVAMYVAFGVVSLGVPMLARRMSRPLQPAWGSGVVLLASLALLVFLSTGPVAAAALWALALLLAILNAGLFIESAAGRLPLVSQLGSIASWVILMVWWGRAAGSVGVLPSITVAVGLALITLLGHGWSVRHVAGSSPDRSPASFANGAYLGLIGHFFLALLAANPEWALPPWPLFGALATVTLATSAAALWSRLPALHMAGAIAASMVVAIWSAIAALESWGLAVVLASGAVSAYALAWIPLGDRFGGRRELAASACAVLFVAECSLIIAVGFGAPPPFLVLLTAHAVNLAVILALTAAFDWPHVAIAAILPAWLAIGQWQVRPDLQQTWSRLLAITGALYAIFAIYPFVLGARARAARDPYIAAIVASVMAFFAARAAFIAGNLEWMIGAIPVAEGAVLAFMLRALLRIEAAGNRDLGRLALVAGAALAFVTVAIPLQLRQQWITIGWALEGAALAWLFLRIPHRGLLYSAVALLGTVFVRLALNPDVFLYEPRGMRVINWYLYTYLLCAAAMLVAGWWLSRTEDRLLGMVRSSELLPAAAIILLFLLVNIEIADFYATGPTIMFRFGVTVAQDLTYTIGWLIFGMVLLAVGIYLGTRPARIAAVSLIAVTTFKCFLYDLGSLEGLHRVASFVGLGISLALVSLALQKYVLSKPRSAA